MQRDKFNIVIIEPSELLTSGLIRTIDDSTAFRVTGSYCDVAEYRDRPTNAPRTDIVIVNPTLLTNNGRKGDIKTLFPDMRLVALLYNYINRDLLQPFHEIIEIYDKPAKVLYKLETVLGQISHESSTPDTGELSDREREILVAVAKGLMNKEIADLCNISIHTVISHRKNISRKTGIKSVSGFVVYALLNNLISEYEIQ